MNPVLLKLDLLACGLRLNPGTEPPAETVSSGGIELQLPSGVRVKAPIDDQLTAGSPYSLHENDGSFYIEKEGRTVSGVEPSPSSLQGLITERGTPMENVASMDGSCLVIFPLGQCDHYRSDGSCGHCPTAVEVQTGSGGEKDLRDVLETVRVARGRFNINRVRLVSGFVHGLELDQIEVYFRAIRDAEGLPLAIEAPPPENFGRYHRLREMGLREISFAIGFYRPDFFRRFCAGLQTEGMRERYLKAIEFCGRTWRPSGRVTVGVTIGVEPLEVTVTALDYFSRIGVVPQLQVLPRTWVEAQGFGGGEKTESLTHVLINQFRACRRRWLPLETYPGTERTALITPYDSRLVATADLRRAA
ncbi:radical SAM protein, partial [candidate division KSB1 bacterium]